MTYDEYVEIAGYLFRQGKHDEAMVYVKKAAKLLLLEEAQKRITNPKR